MRDDWNTEPEFSTFMDGYWKDDEEPDVKSSVHCRDCMARVTTEAAIQDIPNFLKRVEECGWQLVDGYWRCPDHAPLKTAKADGDSA